MKKPAFNSSPFWTLDDLYTAISKQNLETLLGEEIKPGDEKNHAWRRIRFCCEKARKVVMDILGASYDESDFSENSQAKVAVPAIVSECIVVLAAIYLSAENDMNGLTEKLKLRYDDAKETMLKLRDFRISPKVGEKRINNAVYWG